MAKGRKLSPKRSNAMYKRTVNKVHPKNNVKRLPMRGGIRL